MTKRKALTSYNKKDRVIKDMEQLESMKHTNTENKQIAGKLLPAIICFLILVGIDQITKYLVTHNMELFSSIPVIQDVFEIHYIQNPGAAWGILANSYILFYIVTVIVFILGVCFYIQCARFKHFQDFRVLIVLILAGATGNFIDRIRFQYVIDFLYFKLIDFPVFNVADCYVTIGFFCLAFLLLFKYSEEDLEKLFPKTTKSSE